MKPLTDFSRAHAALDSALRLSMAAGRMRRRGEDGRTALDRMRDAQGSLRSARYDGAARNGSAVPDPTGNAGLDRALRDQRLIDRNLRLIVRAAHDLESILARYGEPHPPNAADLLALSKLNVSAEPGCESCARAEGPRGGQRWEPVDSRMPRPTDCGWLDRPMLLCAWCRTRTLEWRRLPSGEELERHHRGERVAWPKDVPRPDRRLREEAS